MTTIHHSEVSPVPGVPKWRGEGGEGELPFPHAVLSFTHFYQAPGTLVTDPLTLRRLGRRRHSPTIQATAKATSANHHIIRETKTDATEPELETGTRRWGHVLY